MMYSNKMAAVIKSSGKVLREFKDEVQIPFGTEYSVLLKNLNSVRASVDITIDGVDVVGGSLIVKPNSECELQRFIKDGNLTSGNSFKFIERTAGIESHRGVKLEDGIVRIEFKYEKLIPAVNITRYNPPLIWNNNTNQIPRGMPGPLGVNYGWVGQGDAYATTISSANTVMQTSASATNASGPVNNVGVTAPGSISSQQFTQGQWFPTEVESHVIILKLVGFAVTGAPIIKPITVKSRAVCTMCGTTAKKAISKFCDKCGASVTIM